MSTQFVRLRAVLQQRSPSVVELGGSYPIAGVRGFGRGMILRPAISGSETGYKSLTRLESGDVVYSKLKAFEGAITVTSAAHEGYFVSPEFPVFERSDDIDPSYLRHLLGTEGFTTRMRSLSSGIGARRERLHPESLLAIEIPLPPLTEQRRIADHLDSVERSTSVDRRTTMEMHWRAVIEQVAGAPQAAARVELQQILSARSGQATSPDEYYRIAGVYSFGRGLLERSSIRGYETKYTTLTQLSTGDVIYSKLGAFEGAVAVVPPDFNGAYVSPEFPVFTVSDEFDSTYLRYCFIATSFVEQLNGATSGVGARQKRVAPRRFLELTVPSRPLKDQRRLAQQLNSLTRTVELAGRADELSAAVLSAARNEIFNSMR